MDTVTSQAQEMYNAYRFGRFNYAAKRPDTEPLLLALLSRTNKDSRLFDIGCGAGFWTDTYVKFGYSPDRITFLDLAPGNVTFLRKQGLHAHCGSVMHLPFKSNVSDLTICNGVIHHTSDPYTAFSEVVRITKPGGYIYLNVYNLWNPYFYIVHKAAFGIRYLYWNLDRRRSSIGLYIPLRVLLSSRWHF